MFVDGVRQTARLARLSCNEIPATGSATVDFVFLARPEVVAVRELEDGGGTHSALG